MKQKMIQIKRIRKKETASEETVPITGLRRLIFFFLILEALSFMIS